MINFNEHVLTVMDIETTGLQFDFHDIIQIALLPLDPVTLDPHPTYGPFYQNICPINPDRVNPVAMKVNGLNMDDLLQCPTIDQVEDSLITWFDNLNLPLGKRLIPLCQNSPFDIGFVRNWLGVDLYEGIFSRRGRDTMFLANGINDREQFRGFAAPFTEIGLKPLCNKFGIEIGGHHDALQDCIATGKLYRELLRFES